MESGPGPDPVDYLGIPLSAEGRAKALRRQRVAQGRLINRVAAAAETILERGTTYVLVGESARRRGLARLREPLPLRIMAAAPPGVDVRIVAVQSGEP